jgi:phosphohistidine phosphatase
MLITCLRHATAQDHALPIADSERALIEKGENQARRVAEFCRKHDLMPSKLYCSPLLRAQQTAELLQSHLPGCPLPIQAEWLALSTSTDQITAELAKLDSLGCKDVWLVGHEPDLSALICRLLLAPDGGILIKKASLSCIEVDISGRTGGQLLWSIPCALMR